MDRNRHWVRWQALWRLFVIVAFGAVLFTTVTPAVAANAVTSDYSTGIPTADADFDTGKAAVWAQTEDFEALPKRRIGNQSAAPAAVVAISALADATGLGACPCFNGLSVVHKTARRNVAAQPRSPPASRS